MKNRGSYFLILICCVCLAFTGGLFIGRNANHAPIQISTAPTRSPDTQKDPVSTADPALPKDKININTANVQQLQTLPGIGPTLAQRIIDYREAHGPFTSPAQLILVEGIGEKRLADIIGLITTE